MTLFFPCSLDRLLNTSFGFTESVVAARVLPYAMAGTLPERRRRLTSPFPRAVRASALSDGSVEVDLVSVAVIVQSPSKGKTRWKRGAGTLSRSARGTVGEIGRAEARV